MKKSETMGTVLNKQWPRNRTVLTEAKLGDTGTVLECSPQKLLTKLVRQSGVSIRVSSVRNTAY